MSNDYTRPPSERTCVSGQSESGKTTFMVRHILPRHKRVLILDQTGEWSVREPQAPCFTSLPQCLDMLDEYSTTERFFLIGNLDNDDVLMLSERLVGIPDVRQGYSYNVGGMALVLTEVDLLIPVSNAPKQLRSLYRRGSHAGLSVIADTQRPGNVSKEATSQCKLLVFFALYEPNDIKYMRAQLGAQYYPAMQWLHGGQYRCIIWNQHDRLLQLVEPSGKVHQTIDAKTARGVQQLSLTEDNDT